LGRYDEAISLFESDDPTKVTDSLAEALFLEIAGSPDFGSLPKENQLETFEKLGTLALLATEYELAVQHYRKAIAIGRSAGLPDSLVFDPTLYLGESYYLLGKADSSLHFLSSAETLLNRPNAANESARLFNSLGVIYYESGNYSQAINYFAKAKNLTIGQRDFSDLEPYYQYALFSFLNNIGSCLVNLDQPDSALSIYQHLLGSGIDPEKTRLQIARIFLGMGHVDSAVTYLDRVEPGGRIAPFWVDLKSESMVQLGADLEAERLLGDYLEHGEESDFRLAPLYNRLGELAFKRGDFSRAANCFHRAIMMADGGFGDSDPFQNPLDYSTGFASNHLFEAMIGKARAFERLASGIDEDRYWKQSLASFQAAFDFAYSVANYYDNDEARLFYSEFVLEGYRQGVGAVLGKYNETGDKSLLEQGFVWVEESKAMGLNIGIRERRLKTLADIPEDLLQKERDLQFSLSQVQQKIFSENNEEQRRILNEAALDKRLELSRLHSQFNGYQGYTQAKRQRKSVDLDGLRTRIGANTLLVSFFDMGAYWDVFLLDGKSLDHYSLSDHDAIESAIRDFRGTISSFELGKKYQRGEVGKDLAALLLAPILPKLSGYDQLVVVPHSTLSGLPFDALETTDGRFLVEEISIGYQLSSTFFALEKREYANARIVGFAPFSSSALKINADSLGRLPYSKEELDAFNGEKFVDSEATKERFRHLLPTTEVLHLATHAVAQSSQPEAAYIAFFPDGGNSKLYPMEISSLSLESTSLVFLSACETNYGPVSTSEGIIGLSRAFAFAGCPNLITSLWKAEDKVNAFISGRFYKYLDEGESYMVALHKAKNDLLSDPSMAQFQHPLFWAHLVFIGDLPQQRTVVRTYILAIAIFLAFGLLSWVWYRSKKRNPS
jgi:CHAT domain-containing protein